MKPLLRGFLPLCLAIGCLLTAVQPSSAQFNKRPRPGNPGMNPGGMNQGNPNDPAAAAAASAASGVGAGMIVGGIAMIVAGLALTGGVVYLGLQGQKTSYAGGTRRRRKKRRDDED